MSGLRYPSVETHVEGIGRGSYCYLKKIRPSSHSAVYLEKIRQGKIELEGLIERRIQRLGDLACNVVLNNDGNGNCSLMQVQTTNYPLEGTSSQPDNDGEEVSLAVQQVVQSYRSSVANTLPPVDAPLNQQVTPAIAVPVQSKAKKPKMTAKERADDSHLKNLLSLQTKMGGPGTGLLAGLSLAMGRKPTQKEKVAAVLQEQITEAMRKKTVNAQNHTHPQTKQVVMKNIKPKPPVNAKLKLFNQEI